MLTESVFQLLRRPRIPFVGGAVFVLISDSVYAHSVVRSRKSRAAQTDWRMVELNFNAPLSVPPPNIHFVDLNESKWNMKLQPKLVGFQLLCSAKSSPKKTSGGGNGGRTEKRIGNIGQSRFILITSRENFNWKCNLHWVWRILPSPTQKKICQSAWSSGAHPNTQVEMLQMKLVSFPTSVNLNKYLQIVGFFF